jgi:hypothetical protein
MSVHPRNRILRRPIRCDSCNSGKIRLVKNSQIYGRLYGQWPLIWYCDTCTAAVGCHPGKSNPLGKMADSATRKMRTRAHEAFDPIWKRSSTLTRGAAYRWLANQLKITESECHMSWFDSDTCKLVVRLCKKYK